MQATIRQRAATADQAPKASSAPAKSIELHGFGPFLGAPDSSPFVIKTMLLLRLAGLAYRNVQGNPFKAPLHFLPFIVDDGVTVADSTLIRRHIEKKYGIDFDASLGPEQRAIGWAIERMCEDHLYFAMLELRWLDKENFANGLGRHMFGVVPAPVRPVAKIMLRRMNAKRLFGHGIGRHAKADIAALAIRDLDALAALLGNKPFLMGDKPCAADATAFGIVTSIITPRLDSAIVQAARGHANLVAYRDRIAGRYFPKLAGT
jgi:glutathione S-transferase